MAAKTERPKRYVGMATVGRWIGTTGATVAVYRKRYEETDHPCPPPDALIVEEREVPGWLPERESEWRTWAENRPGQGAGGGRPRKERDESGGSVRRKRAPAVKEE